VIRAHQDASGGKGDPMQCSGPLSRGATKLHAIVAKGRPLYVTLTPGERHEMTKAEELLAHANGKAFIGDTGYDSEPFAKQVRAKGMKFVVARTRRASASGGTIARCTSSANTSRSTSTTSSAFVRSRPGTTRPRAATSRCCTSPVCGSGSRRNRPRRQRACTRSRRSRARGERRASTIRNTP